MKEHTDEEIVEKVTEIVTSNPDNYDWRETEIKVHRFNDEYIELSIAQMYERPQLRFEDINKLAKFFDTMNIETGSEFGSGGCESCDWGSEYGFTLYVSPGDPYREVGQND